MKFFHLSDLHIGLKLINRDLKEDQDYILGEIVRIAGEEQPDAVLVAGDIYDKSVPSAEAVQLFDRFMSDLIQTLPSSQIMVISGNHDSAQRLNLFRNVLKSRNVHMIGLPPQEEGDRIEKVTISDAYGNVNFYLLPFVRPSMVKAVTGTDEAGNNLTYQEAVKKLLERETLNLEERNVFVSHQFYLPAGEDPEKIERMDSEIRTVGNIDEVSADLLKDFDYAALGHIHKPMKVGKETIRYCGTPLAVSVSEAGQEKGIVVVEMNDKADTKIRVIPLKPLREVRVIKGSLEEVLSHGCEDYVSVQLTDRVDLDVIDMQDRLRNAFPNLLEIRRQTVSVRNDAESFTAEEMPEPFDLCLSFLGDPDEEDRELLADVINTVLEASGK